MLKDREYGLDLLKIISMVFIVLDHILYWGGYGFCAGRSDVKGIAIETLDAVCLCHVNCFVLASGWIMSRLDFKFKRIARLWIEVVGYSLIFLLLAWLYFPSINIGVKDIIKNLLPISSDRYWFFTQYFVLFCAMPLLNVVIQRINRRVLLFVLGIGFICFSVHPFFFKTDIFHLNRGYSALWFMYLYLLAGCMSVRGLFQDTTKWKMALVAIMSIGGCVGALHLARYSLASIGPLFKADLFRAYNCPFIFLYSVATFIFFSKVIIRSDWLKALVGLIAPSVFAVYVIHSNRVFRAMTNWNETWGSFLDGHSTGICMMAAAISAILIFSGSIAIDIIRRRILTMLFSLLPRTSKR